MRRGVFLAGLLIFSIKIGLIEYVYKKMGINPRHVFALLLLSLLGSAGNTRLPSCPMSGCSPVK